MFDCQPILTGQLLELRPLRQDDWAQVLFRIGPENRRSRRAVEKIGAVYLRVAPDARGRDSVVYVLTKTA